MRGTRLTLSIALALYAMRSALAQTAPSQEPPVWRCGNSYSHQPCAAGKPVDTRDARTPQQREQALEQQRRLDALLAARQAERAAEQARQRRERADALRAQRDALRLQHLAARQAQAAQTERRRHRHPPAARRKAIAAPPASAAAR
ncbi:MAG: hypothetical protein ACP5F9_07485 [Thiomonas sp.]|jgi:hypothetical protein